ncbi:uncharacterized protein RJT21DRAFT_111250 [Scheffersomyces amazonensis]|uniref:uncharacterized protein n=1 Tax=Scheffersomyces amazonensis TaxID=1078765 RepID=UPI00315C7342
MSRRVWQLLISLLSLLTVITCSSSQAIRLTEEALKYDNNIIQISNSDLSLFSGPRDYSTVLILTSTNRNHVCAVCMDLEKIVSQVTKSWYSDYLHTNSLFFANIDLIDASNSKIFQYLDIKNIPHIWLIPPNESIDFADSEIENFEFKILDDGHFVFQVPIAKIDDQVMELARFLTQNLQKSITVREQSPISTFVKTFAVTFFVILIIKKNGPSKFRNLPKKNALTIILISLMLVCLGGYQFTIQHGTPFVAKGHKGQIIFISGGTHYQFGVEILIVGINYTTLAFALVSLIHLGNYKVTSTSLIKSNKSRYIIIMVINILLYILYSSLTSIVLRKDHGYPYAFSKLF